jgi:pimeloyl-ACP methyl ester carboxylesterase
MDKARIGLLGHSEGGFVAPIVAAGDSSIAFLLLLGAPAVMGRDVLTAQRSMLARASGTPNIEITVDSLMLATIFSVLDTPLDTARLGATVDSALTRWRTALPATEREVADALLGARSSPQDSTSIELWKSRWFTSFYHHDPAPYLRRVRVPVFALIGELDLQVPAAQSAAGFESLFESRRHLLTFHRLPGINHMLQPARTGRMEEYLEIRETIAPDVLTRIEQWLTRVVPVTTPPR